MRTLSSSVVALLAVLSAVPVQSADPALQFRKVLLTGEPAPGAEPSLLDEIGTYVDIFNPDPFTGLASRGPVGDIGIVAEQGGDGMPSTPDSLGSGVWRESGGIVSLVVLEGDPAPGTSGTFTGFPNFSAATPADHGDGVALVATVPGAFPGTDLFGLWSTRGGQLQKLMLENEPLAGLPPGGTMFSQFASVARGTTVLFNGRWCFGGGCALRDEGLWRDVSGSLDPVVLRGDPAPGFARGQVFDDFGNASANTGPVDLWNGSEQGRVIFSGYVVGPRIKSGNNEGLWVEGAAGLALLAREGGKVPGKPGWRWGAMSGFRAFGDDTMLRAHILTSNGFSLWGASINNNKYNRVGGVWSTRTGAVVQIVQTVRRDAGVGGQPPQNLATPAPGFGPGRYFRQVFSGRINVNGEIYFDADVADLADPENPDPEAGIFRLGPGSSVIGLFARKDGPVPGIPGTTFDAVGIGRLFDTGHYLWVGRLQGPGVDPSNDLAAFLTDPSGVIQLVCRTGDTIDVFGDGTDLRVLANFGTDTGPREGGGTIEQVFEFLFTDGSAGVFLGSVPSP